MMSLLNHKVDALVVDTASHPIVHQYVTLLSPNIGETVAVAVPFCLGWHWAGDDHWFPVSRAQWLPPRMLSTLGVQWSGLE